MPSRKSLILAIIGTIPGIIVISLGFFNQGLGLLIAGFCIGGLMGVPGVVPLRVLKLFGVVLAVKATRGLKEPLIDLVDGGEQEEDSDGGFVTWLTASHVINQRGWIVVVAVIIGAVVGGGICFKEMSDIKEGVATYFLPIEGAKDSLSTQAGMITFSITIWFGILGSFIASSTYRRPVGGVAFVSSLIGVCVSLITNFSISLNVVFFLFVPVVSGIALFVMVMAAFESPVTEVDKKE